MSARSEFVAILLALGLCAACPMLGNDDETFEGSPTSDSDRVPVVDDVGDFDPSEAVDDDDGDVVLDDTDDVTDGPAFADEDGAKATVAADSAENERGDAKPGEEHEHVAGEAEVEHKELERERQVEVAKEGAGDEDERKAELDRNPPPETAPESEEPADVALDTALEALLVALAGALLTTALVFARTHVKTVAFGAIALGVVAWFVLRQLH